jgi:hypothetical protein
LIFKTFWILVILLEPVFTKPMVGQNVRRAIEGEFSPVVTIKKFTHRNIPPEDTRICSGTLISIFHVITAAHCLEIIRFSLMEIIVGSIDIRQGMRYHPLWIVDYNRWANLSDLYRKYRINDIAIIKVNIYIYIYMFVYQ